MVQYYYPCRTFDPLIKLNLIIQLFFRFVKFNSEESFYWTTQKVTAHFGYGEAFPLSDSNPSFHVHSPPTLPKPPCWWQMCHLQRTEQPGKMRRRGCFPLLGFKFPLPCHIDLVPVPSIWSSLWNQVNCFFRLFRYQSGIIFKGRMSEKETRWHLIIYWPLPLINNFEHFNQGACY